MPRTSAVDAPLANANCFGCGSANSAGLHLHFTAHPDGGVQAEFEPRPEHQGWDGVVHGGLVAVLLDESMAWAAASKTVKYVTARLEVRYRHPVTVGQPVLLRGWVEQDRGRALDSRAQVLDATGSVLAEANALFIRAPGL
ncbi:MAG: PaaI family thioesterase [Chloroflexota bacterium]